MALSTFEELEYLLYTKLNTFSAEIEARLQAVSGSNMAWPLLTGGNIDMGREWTIVGMQNMWNIIYAGEYDTLQDAIDDGEGKVILLPPGTTKSTTGITINNSNTWLVGMGYSSVLAISSGAGPLLDTATSGISNVGLASFKIDASGGTAAPAVVAKYVDHFAMHDILVTSPTADAIYLTHSGTQANGCTDAILTNITIDGGTGTGYHIHGDSVDGLVLAGIHSLGAPADAIYFEPAAASAPIRDIVASSIRIDSPIGKGLVILSNSATEDAKWSGINCQNILVNSPTDDGFQLGDTSKKLLDLTVTGCAVTSPGADAFVVNAAYGVLSGCNGAKANTGSNDGLDLLASEDLTVSGCNFADAGAYGIDMGTSTDCRVHGNDVTGAGTQPILAESATTPDIYGNTGQVDKTGDTSYVIQGAAGNITGAAEDSLGTYTIPGNTLSKAGDGFRITAHATAGGTDAMTFLAELGGETLCSFSIPTSEKRMIIVDAWINNNGASSVSNNVSFSWCAIGDADKTGTSTGSVNVDMTADAIINIAGNNDSVQSSTIDLARIELFGGQLILGS